MTGGDSLDIRPIGVIRTPFESVAGIPVQPLSGKGIRGMIILREEYAEGLKDLDGFSHATLIYHLHRAAAPALRVVPFMDDEEHGIFATRSPRRPNRIGISTVRILKVDKNEIEIEDLDMIDGTPLLDIKPFFPEFDNRHGGRAGWLEKRKGENKEGCRSDDRFTGE